MSLLSRIPIRSWPRAVVAYLGDAGHRRFVSVIVAMLATHFLGKAVGADTVANVIDVVLGGIGSWWDHNSVQPPAEVAQ